MEILDPDHDSILREIIKQNMIHGSYGKFVKDNKYMVNIICSKNFPKHFILITITREDGYT